MKFKTKATIGLVGSTAALMGAGAAVGSVAGAAWGGNTPGANANEMSKIGMAAGIAGGAAVGLVAGNAKPIGKAIGAVGLGTAEVAGAGIIGAAELAGAAAIGFASKVAAPVAAYGAQKYASIGAGVGKGIDKLLLKPDKNPANLLGRKLTAAGAGVLVGSALFGGTREAFGQMTSNRMGQSDGALTRATPRTPSYSNNAGATGDLVFAMNANRRG